MKREYLNLLEPVKSLIDQLVEVGHNLLSVIAVLLVGWVLAKTLSFLTVKLLEKIRLEEFADKIGLSRIFIAGGITEELPDLIGKILYWFLIFSSIVVAATVIGLTDFFGVLGKIMQFVPRVFAVLFILMAGSFIAQVLKKTVMLVANRPHSKPIRLLTSITYAVVITFTFFIALEQIGVGIRFLKMIVSIFLASIGLSLAIAFGLGAKDVLRSAVSNFFKK